MLLLLLTVMLTVGYFLGLIKARAHFRPLLKVAYSRGVDDATREILYG